MDQPKHPGFAIEKMGESGGYCDCCGNASRCVWGMVYNDSAAIAAYWMHWTVSHLSDPGANLDLVIGKWGDETTADDRVAVALIHREMEDGKPSLMVANANGRPVGNGNLASVALAREDVIGTPLAANVFALVDAIYEQDERFF